MEYTQTHSTRKWSFLLLGSLFLALGGYLTQVLFYGVLFEGATGLIIPGFISLLMLMFGIAFVYRFFFLRFAKGIINEQAIRCKLGNKLRLEIHKDDIEYIAIPSSHKDSIVAVLKPGKGLQKIIKGIYFQDLDKLRKDLDSLGYRTSVLNDEHTVELTDNN